VQELDEICRLLGSEPVEIIRSKDRLFRQLGLSKDDQRSRREWLEILAENSALLERPIVVRGDRAVIARPPERLLDLF
jgi:arsenate reductase